MDERLDGILLELLPVFQQGGLNCAETVLTVMLRHYDLEAPFAPRIATAFGGGLCGTQGACGALTGALMVVGLKLGREQGGDKAPANEAGKRLMAEFERLTTSTACREITGVDFQNPAEQRAFRAEGGGHQRICGRLVAEICRYLAQNL